MSTYGFDFTLRTGGLIQSTEEAKAVMKQFLVPEAEVAIHSMEFDYLGDHGQSRHIALGCVIEGKVWIDHGE